MLAMTSQDLAVAEHETEFTTKTDLESPPMMLMRLKVAISILLDKNDNTVVWQDTGKELIKLTKLGPSGDRHCDIGQYRISHRRHLSLYTLEDTHKGVFRVLRYSDTHQPELVLEPEIDTEGKRIWKVVYSIGGKYPLPGATMQVRTD